MNRLMGIKLLAGGRSLKRLKNLTETFNFKIPESLSG